MIKIDKRDYINFYEIFSELGSYTFMLSALDGIVKSELYADDIQKPTYAVLLTKDLNYIVGDLSSNELKQGLFDLSMSDNFLRYTGFIFLAENAGRMKEIFGNHTYDYKDRKNFKLMASEYKAVVTDENAEIVKLTPDNIKTYSDYANYDAVYEGCMFYWEEYPYDSKINFSTALVQDKAFMSCCYLCGESSSENSCEIGVDTFEPFRRNGYADLVCRETLNELINYGYNSFNWHCFIDNIPSYNTASKLGYKQVGKSHLCWFRKDFD
jgi:RimJ/RimL family protein N-acetyltransferase